MRSPVQIWLAAPIFFLIAKYAAIAQPVERILGKDEVASSNLASSSKTPDSYLESGVFLCSAVHSILNLDLMNSWIFWKHRPHPYWIFSRCKGCGIVMSKKLSLVNTSASSLKEVWECGFVLRWLQGIASIATGGQWCSIFHSSPCRNLPLRFSISIAYQKEREKAEVSNFYWIFWTVVIVYSCDAIQ